MDFIATKSELDEFEQKNIEEAFAWILGRKLNAKQILDEKFILQLHKRMFGHVWRWAGKYRTSEKNIGVKSYTIPLELKKLLDDTLFWIDNNTFSPDEIAMRFKHRLVSIHCFANGNGRHSRMMADIIIEKIYGKPAFTWGAALLNETGKSRNIYIKAIKQADKGDISELLVFARS